MSTRDTAFTVHPALGGLDISSDPTVLDPGFLVNADNIEYREGGQRKKRPGFRVYSTAVTSTEVASTGSVMVSTSAPVRAIKDVWRYGASLTPTQAYVAVASASIFVSTDANGTWTPLTVSSSFGSATNRNTSITLAGDYAVISDGETAPIAWDGTATSSGLVSVPSTSTAWPVFTDSVYHLNRLWMHGISTAPSELKYTAANNIFDSTGGDTGSFTVNVGDGDRIMGVSRPFYGSLYIFKGPQKGSVYQLSGATAATFALAQVSHGAPLLNNRALVTTPSDIYWLSQYGVHSLQTTVKFGNVEQAFLSLPIQKLWRNRLIKRSKLGETWGFWHPQRNIVGWVVYLEGELMQRAVLAYNYALSDPKPGGKKFWSIWKLENGVSALCGDVMLVGPLDPNHTGDPHLWLGTDQGVVWEGDQEQALNDAGAAYTARITTPTLTKLKGRSEAPETFEKGFVGVVTYFGPHGNVSANLSVTVDNRVQSTTVTLTGGGDTLT